MSAIKLPSASRIIDVPLALAAVLTAGYYWVITQESMHDTLLHSYTTQHAVEYVIVAFFIWGISDTICRALTFPRENLALRMELLPPRKGSVPVSQAAVLLKQMQTKPRWLLNSRLGLRMAQALTHLTEKGSAEGFADYLRDLADQDEERTHSNFGLVRFICWVTPVLGFLGTVLHFGTALGGLSAEQIGEKLAHVVGEMGTAFNTTTVALTAATSMMFFLFLCERTEKEIIHMIDRRVDRDLLNRFEITDANITPFLGALQTASQATLAAVDATIARQMEVWSGALEALEQQSTGQQQRQTQLWQEVIGSLQERFEAQDVDREKRLVRLLDAVATQQSEHRVHLQATTEQMQTLQAGLIRVADSLSGLTGGGEELIALQVSLADNLRVLRESQHLDQALHTLTGAIHMLTARAAPSQRAA